MTAPLDPKNDWVPKNPTDPESEWRYTADEQNLVAENIIWIKANGGGGGATNLSTTRTASAVTVVATPGTDAAIPAADGTNAGVMTAAQQVKLAGIATGADVTNATTVAAAGALMTTAAPELIRDTMGTALAQGANITITPNDAGDIITIAAAGGAGATNLTTTRTASTVTVLSDTGTDATLVAADGTNAGIMTSAQQLTLAGAIQTATKNQPNGVAGLDGSGLVPTALLPGAVDELLEYANFAAFPVTGATDKMYIALNTGIIYRWSGSVYGQIPGSPGTTDAVPEGTTNLYYTNARVAAAPSVTAKLDTSAAPELIRDTIGTALTAGSNVTITPNDAGDIITIAATPGGGGGDASTNTAVSIDNEGVLFSGTTGKTMKRSTATGIIKQTSGVQSTAVAGTDYFAPGGTDIPITDGGTGASTLPTGLLKGAGTGAITAATAGTDYFVPGGTDIPIADGGTGASTLPTGLLKGAGTSPITGAVQGTDYYAPAGTDVAIADGGTGASTLPAGLLKGAGTGAITAGVQGTDYYAPAGTDVAIADGGTGASTAAAARTNLAPRIPRVATPVTNVTSWTVNADLADVAENNGLTASVLINNPTGTPVANQELVLAVTGTAARAITYGTAFEASAIPLPTTTVTTARLDIHFRWNTATSRWRCIYYTTSAAGAYTPGGTDVALADGGTGTSLTAPVADRIMFYDVSAGSTAYLTAGSGLTITGTTMTASGGGGGATNVPSGWADVVRDHGAVADGVTNDGNAFRAAAATGLPVWVPAGNYAFSGAGISQNDLYIAGPGPGLTHIYLGAGVYFIDGTNDVNTLTLSGINFIGGAGTFRSTYTGVAVRGYRRFENCLFHDYTATCIGHRHQDSPYWVFRDCEFRGANDTACIGIALNGLNDDNLISHCTFELNRVHLKLKEGANAHIQGGCSFFRWIDYTSNPRIDIWLVPRTQAEVTAAEGNFADAGSGFSVQETKFGNEGLAPQDYRVVIADALAGNFETALPNLAANSTSVWIGGTFTNLHNSLIGGQVPPFIYSTTPNLYAVQAGNFAHIGSDSLAAARVLLLRTATGFDPTINAIGPVMTGADPINGQVLVAATSGTLTGQPKYIGGGS